MDGQRHKLIVYRILPRPFRMGRPSKQPPREIVVKYDDIAPEALDPLKDVLVRGLGAGTVLEQDDAPIAWGPKVVDSPKDVASAYVPTTVEVLPPGGPPDGAQPSEVVRFNLELAWDTYRRGVNEIDDMIERQRRMAAQASQQYESYVHATQRLMELEAELKAITAEERVRQAEAERQEARRRAEQQAEAQAGPRFTSDDLIGVLRTLVDTLRKTG